jgi:hypothetical protein
MSDQTKRGLIDLNQEVTIEMDPELAKALEVVTLNGQMAAASIVEGVNVSDIRSFAERIQEDHEATAIAISSDAAPGSEDYYLDLWAFSTTQFPGGLGLTAEQFWDLTPREWWARYRVWERHVNSNRHGDRPSIFERRQSQSVKLLSAVVGEKRRGRPVEIPDVLKDEALAIRDAGGSNSDAARKLYNTQCPTAQQVKNASTILRVYRKKLAAGE